MVSFFNTLGFLLSLLTSRFWLLILTLALLLFVMEVVERKENKRNYLDGGGGQRTWRRFRRLDGEGMTMTLACLDSWYSVLLFFACWFDDDTWELCISLFLFFSGCLALYASLSSSLSLSSVASELPWDIDLNLSLPRFCMLDDDWYVAFSVCPVMTRFWGLLCVAFECLSLICLVACCF